MANQCEYCGRWDSRATVVDGIVVRNRQVLLIKRGIEPHKGEYAIPGGYMDRDETAEDACIREVLEETGLQVEVVEFLGYYDDPKRDRERQNVSLVFVCRAVSGSGEVQGGDDAEEAAWFPLNQLPKLAFDHEQVLSDFVESREPC